jgi:hypothetical protein
MKLMPDFGAGDLVLVFIKNLALLHGHVAFKKKQESKKISSQQLVQSLPI